MQEHGGTLDASTKARIEAAVANAKKALDSEDVVELKRAADELTQASHTLAEAMYAQTTKAGGASEQTGAAGTREGGRTSRDNDNVIDVDFEEIR